MKRHLRGAALSALAVATADPLGAQALRGLVREEGEGPAIPYAVVRLEAPDGEGVAVTLSGSGGAYRMAVPGPGAYRIAVEALGYAPFTSPLLEVGTRPHYDLHLILESAPVEVEGLTVTADATQLDRAVRRWTGLQPKAMRYQPILRTQLDRHIRSGQNLVHLIRNANMASIVIRQIRGGPCFTWRGGRTWRPGEGPRFTCLPVYLDGLPFPRDVIEGLPLEMLETVLVVSPVESAMYPGGAILLFSIGWTR